jgi:hypothetical protein
MDDDQSSIVCAIGDISSPFRHQLDLGDAGYCDGGDCHWAGGAFSRGCT